MTDDDTFYFYDRHDRVAYYKKVSIGIRADRTGDDEAAHFFLAALFF